MKTTSKKTRKLIAGLSLAILAVGFSAFTNARVDVTYFNTSSNPNSTNRTDYVLSEDHLCISGSNNCSYTTDVSGTPPTNPPESSWNPNNIQQGSLQESE